MTEYKKEELIYLAKICEQTERYNEMLEFIRTYLNHAQTDTLSVEDRNLLSVAYKNCVGNKRTSWRILETLEKKEESKNTTAETQKHLTIIRNLKKQIEKELNDICQEIIKVLDTRLIPKAAEFSEKVFYHKMKGDYLRYIAEYCPQDEKEAVAKNAFEAYSNAQSIALSNLETTDPVRLGLALNFSVFHYEIKNDPKQACQIAKTAFDDAIADIENIQDANYKDSTTIMQLMKDNLTLWTSELEEDDDGNGDDDN